jgi:GR25 family glycosyltransferase involved in LPS biosynthesis
MLSIIHFLLSCKNTENFDNPKITDNNIKIYVITLRQQQRMENIKEQQKKIKRNIEIVDAVNGDTLNTDELIKGGLLSESYKNPTKTNKREIGCYMSHMNLYNLIKTNNIRGYTLILEDDCNFISTDFMDVLKDSINKLRNYDYDFFYLGNLENNRGELIVDNIYKANDNEELYGTHCYLVNNKNIDKIINSTKFIASPIDNTIHDLSKKKILNVLVMYPVIATQSGSSYSTIRD